MLLVVLPSESNIKDSYCCLIISYKVMWSNSLLFAEGGLLNFGSFAAIVPSPKDCIVFVAISCCSGVLGLIFNTINEKITVFRMRWMKLIIFGLCGGFFIWIDVFVFQSVWFSKIYFYIYRYISGRTGKLLEVLFVACLTALFACIHIWVYPDCKVAPPDYPSLYPVQVPA